MKPALLLALLLLIWLCSASVLAASPVWRISNAQGSLYLGGTIHLLADSDYPLPAAFTRAYQDSQEVWLETDLTAMASPAFRQTYMQAMLLPTGNSLQQRLSEDTYGQLSAFARKHQLDLDRFAGYKPVLLALTLTLQALRRLGIHAEGVDAHYYAKARADGRPLRALETPEQQIGYLSGMADGQEDALVRATLKELDGIEQSMASLRQAWRRGDAEGLMPLIAELQQFPQAYDVLIRQRNGRWMTQLQQELADPGVELVLVGVAHLIGEEGLVAQFKRMGAQVEQL